MACNPCTRWLGLCNAAKEESRKCKPHAIGKTTEVFRLHLACKKISVQHAETFCKLSALHKVGVVSFCFISALARASLILEYVAFVKCFMLKRTAGFLSHEASDNGLKTIFERHFFFFHSTQNISTIHRNFNSAFTTAAVYYYYCHYY